MLGDLLACELCRVQNVQRAPLQARQPFLLRTELLTAWEAPGAGGGALPAAPTQGSQGLARPKPMPVAGNALRILTRPARQPGGGSEVGVHLDDVPPPPGRRPALGQRSLSVSSVPVLRTDV